ncbi:MAG: dihydropteroate synthase, partial [Clostridia bacterium]|nr:dihydropteroate synthase [Clostridia bacterium]
SCLDLNTGPAVPAEKQPEVMQWLVETVQEVSTLPCCLDSTNPKAIEAGLKVHTNGSALINSINAEPAQMDLYLPMAATYGASVIGLAMNNEGVPASSSERLTLAMEMVVAADAEGLPLQNLYIDPLLLPVNVAQNQAWEVLETLRQVKTLAPDLKTILGLSNISQGCGQRYLLNRTFLVMAMTCGLDSAILDLQDENLLAAVAAARVLLNQEIYCDSFCRIVK